MEVGASFMYIRPIQVSSLALTQPFLAVTPLFTVLTGQWITGEAPTPAGLMGLLLLAAGAYGLNLYLTRSGWLEPWRAVRREQGFWMMLCVAVIYAYTSVLGRKAVQHSSPLFIGAVYPLLVGLGVITILGIRRQLAWGWPCA